MHASKLSGLSIAVAAAALFMGAPIAQASDHGKAEVGHCVGTNACKGQGACKSAANACKGQNACKGHGFTESTASACKTAGGKFEMPKPAAPQADKPQS
jgi:hypothetical protein